MKFGTLLLTSLLVGHALPVLGDCDNKRSALSDFGLVALGDNQNKLPRDLDHLPNCEVYGDIYADCEFLDKSGIGYGVFGDRVESKNILIHRTMRAPLLPFGLKATDKIADVVRKITPRDDAPDFYILYRDKKIQLFSGLCVTNALGSEFAVEFSFRPDETLEEMSVLVDSPGN